MHTASYDFLMKESVKCYQTLSLWVGSGHESLWCVLGVNTNLLTSFPGPYRSGNEAIQLLSVIGMGLEWSGNKTHQEVRVGSR